MTLNKKIGFIGGGRVTKILLGGLNKKGLSGRSICIYDPDTKALRNLSNRYPAVNVDSKNPSSAAKQDLIFLAVHPPVVNEALASLKELINRKGILVSLVPKIKCSQLREMLGGFSRIVRMIPNAPSIICRGFNPVYFSEGINQNERDDLQLIFNSIGCSPIVEENLLEAYAVITGMGPTYFWRQFQQLKELALEFGIETGEAEDSIKSMVTGSIETLFSGDLQSEEVFDLIPVYPLAETQELLLKEYRTKLTALYKKIT